MESPLGDILENGVDYEDKVIALDLEFLFNTFLREGANINMRVIKGVPEGAKALAAGISGDSLIVVFDTKVPKEVWFEDKDIQVINPELN